MTLGAGNLFYLYDNATLPCSLTLSHSLLVTWWAQAGKLITWSGPAGLKLSWVSAQGKYKQHYKFAWGNPHSQCWVLKGTCLLCHSCREERNMTQHILCSYSSLLGLGENSFPRKDNEKLSHFCQNSFLNWGDVSLFFWYFFIIGAHWCTKFL